MSDCTTCTYHREHRKRPCAFGHIGKCPGDWMQANLSNLDTETMLLDTANVLREIARQLEFEAQTQDALMYYYLTRCDILMSEMARRVQIATCRSKRAKTTA